MDTNADERKRKRDEEQLSRVAAEFWSQARDSLSHTDIDDQDELKGYVMKLDVKDGETDESLLNKVFSDVVIPRALKVRDELRRYTIGQQLKFHREEAEEGREQLKMKGAVDGAGTMDTKEHAKDTSTSMVAPFVVDDISYHTREIEDQPSCLLAMIRPLQCYNKASVQAVVTNLVHDALRYVNWASKDILAKDAGLVKLTLRIEEGIYSNKPDHIVVYSRAGNHCAPVLSVEVKHPRDPAVCKSLTDDGQILDYLMSTRLQHGNYAFGVVTAFTQTKVVWVRQEGCVSAASAEGRMQQAALSAVFREIAVGKGAPEDQNTPAPPQRKKDTPPPPSPTSPTSRSLNETEPAREDGNVCEFVRSTDTYKEHQLFTVLCNAIFASLSVMGREESLQISAESFETNGMVPKGQPVLVLVSTATAGAGAGAGAAQGAGQHRWMTLGGCIKVEQALRVAHPLPAQFYVVEHLGVGRTSRTWRAVAKTSTGQWATCVLKYWVLVHNMEDNQEIEEEEVEAMSSKATADEVANYRAIYGELEDLIARLRLCGRWCVILPFFVVLTKEERMDESVRSEIKNVLLNNFYDKGRRVSYRFEESDQRWRHIGKRGGKIYIFDLGDLIVMKSVTFEDHKQYVEGHLNNLFPRAIAPTSDDDDENSGYESGRTV